jgi:hypothetical protein
VTKQVKAGSKKPAAQKSPPRAAAAKAEQADDKPAVKGEAVAPPHPRLRNSLWHPRGHGVALGSLGQNRQNRQIPTPI